MVIIGYILMLLFCASVTFLIMTLILGKTNVKDDKEDPSSFLMGDISYIANEEFGQDYRTDLPHFMTRYGFDYKAFPDQKDGSVS